VLGKLDREAVVRAAVHAGDVAFDDPPGSQRQSFKTRQDLRI
jgi:hypothetical protein